MNYSTNISVFKLQCEPRLAITNLGFRTVCIPSALELRSSKSLSLVRAVSEWLGDQGERRVWGVQRGHVP